MAEATRRLTYNAGTIMSHTPLRVAAGLAVAALFLATTTAGLGAFGDAGHRIVGRIAELHLRNSRALGELGKILKPNETLADAAVWPDVIKNPLYEDDDTALFRLNHPAHDTYHYANLPFQAPRYEPSVTGARPTDIVQTARECIRVLRGTSRVFTRREALRVLAHLVGDVHQPLHTGNAFVSASTPLEFVVPKGPAGWRSTLGGNTLVYGPEHRFNLHSYWDSHAVNISMGQDDIAGYATRLFNQVPVAPGWRTGGDAETWPEQWATESLALARDAHRNLALLEYIGPDDQKRFAHRWTVRQPAGYDDFAKSRVPAQLAAAGYRLAATLQAIWPN
jgi:hypothetical protein